MLTAMTDADPRHGTYAGVMAHTARREKPCEPCREARTEYMRDRRMRLSSQRAFILPIEMVPEMADFDGIGASIARGLRESA